MFQERLVNGFLVRLTMVRATLVVARDEWDHELQRVAPVPDALECELESHEGVRVRVTVDAFRGTEEAFREAFHALAKYSPQ